MDKRRSIKFWLKRVFLIESASFSQQTVNKNIEVQ
jgi:hypothetical protein